MNSVAGVRMMSYLPEQYEQSRVMTSLQDGLGGDIDMIMQALDETLDQAFIDTATWSLDTWEGELGLHPNPSLSEQERRDRVKSRKRGLGTARAAMIKGVAEAFDGGEIAVIEDFAARTITILFISIRGVPSNLSDLQDALRAVIPAHLDVIYAYSFLRFDSLSASGLTWSGINAKGLNWAQFQTMAV